MGSNAGWIGAIISGGFNLFGLLAGNVYLTSDARRFRKIERDLSIFDRLPADAKNHLEQLLNFEVAEYSTNRARRARRQFRKTALPTLIFVLVVTAAVGWGLARLAISYGWGWWIPFGIWTSFGLLLGSAGLGQLYDDPGGDSDPVPTG